MQQFSLQGKVAIVTGGAHGIGQVISQEMAKVGASTVIADIDVEKAEQVAAQINRSGGSALALKCDVADEASVKGMVSRAIDRFKTVNILVNNVGIYPRKTWYEITVQEWDQMMAVNLRSMFLCAREVFPFMRSSGGGKIINIASITFHVGFKNLLHYIASKGGVVGFTRALARELGEFNINVNAISPGAVETETEKNFVTPEQIEWFLSEQCLKRRIVPADIANTVIFLASDASGGITGQTISVDGGWAMR